MKKHILTSLLTLLMLTISINNCQAVNDDIEINEKISKIGFYKIFSSDPQKEITDLFNKVVKYSSNKDFKKLYNIYDDAFVSSDGFDKETYFDMIKKSWELYPKVTYAIEVKDIQIDGNYAIARIVESSEGETKDSYEHLTAKGILTSVSTGYYYLQKHGTDWKIASSTIITENATLKYGMAHDCDITISAPNQVRAGEDYTVSINMNVPEQTFIIGAISNEPIIYPQLPPKDVFRTIKKNGVLERVFTANKDNHNEFATASIGFTQAAVIDAKSINVKITGMAFIMTRINVVNKVNPPAPPESIASKKVISEEEIIDEEESNEQY